MFMPVRVHRQPVSINTTEAHIASIFRNEATQVGEGAIITRDICRLDAFRVKAAPDLVPSPCHSCGEIFPQTRRHGPHELREEGAEGSIAA